MLEIRPVSALFLATSLSLAAGPALAADPPAEAESATDDAKGGLPSPGWPGPAERKSYKPMKHDFDADGEQWVRFIAWQQLWVRAMEMNPDTQVNGNDRDLAVDIGIRRARGLVVAQPFPKTQFLFHFGINNQTFNNARKPQLYIHDLWASYTLDKEGVITLGAGLHYFNGVSRLANASTLNFLALDAPISNWTTIERTDQFARMMGLFAKGHKGRFQYRVALNKPFTPSTTPAPDGPGEYNPQADTLATAGYVELHLDEKESDLLPYKVGTYLGKKSVFNIGLGWHYHPKGSATADSAGELTPIDQVALGIDVFADQPVGEDGAAFTAYVGYWYHDFGPDNVRNVGIMNIGAGGSSFNGAGNAYPILGTGHHVYAQAGFLLPGRPGGIQIQPYATTQFSIMEALGSPMVAPEAGVNWFIEGHHVKITTHWRNRPVYAAGADPTVESRANEFITQFAMFL